MHKFKTFVFAAILAISTSALGAGNKSIYSAPLKWVNDEGKATQLSDWQGKNVILTMAYTSCHGSCPLIIKKLRNIEKMFQDKAREVSFVIVTFDPKKDTPEELKAFRDRSGITEKNWTFLTGKEADVRKLSMLLGINFSKPPGSTEIMHDNRIFLLSTKGEIMSRLNSLEDKDELLLK